jgi:hypothetical protein
VFAGKRRVEPDIVAAAQALAAQRGLGFPTPTIFGSLEVQAVLREFAAASG